MRDMAKFGDFLDICTLENGIEARIDSDIHLAAEIYHFGPSFA
jgi:hypothetical protein